MADRLIAIGDIHGCLTALTTLLDAVAPTSDDTIVTIGDYVDRGDNTRGVIDRLIDLRSQCQLVPIMGNHEEMMLAARANWIAYQHWMMVGGVPTMASYGDHWDDVPADHFQFIESCHNYYETDTHFFLHANYAPKIALPMQDVRMSRWLSLHFASK